MPNSGNRRAFLSNLGLGTGAGLVSLCCKPREVLENVVHSSSPPQPKPPTVKPPTVKNEAPDLGEVKLAMRGPLPTRRLGRTGVDVSLLALGGYHLGTVENQALATRIVHEALEHGVNFFDNAWEYHDGKSEEWMGNALKGKRDKAFLMTKVCTHGRDAKTALSMLEDSLRRLRTDVIDLWQVHEVIYDSEPEQYYQAGGVLEALDQAKRAGKVRFVGFTGHKDPSIHLDMLQRGYAFDSCQMPLNCFDGNGFRSFEKHVLPELGRRGIAALGMKSMGGAGDAVKKGALSPAEALGYALSLPVASVISGIDSLAVLRQNLNIAGGFEPWSAAQMQELRDRVRPYAMDGRFELFKTSKKYDGKPGREQHGFPSEEELGG